MDVRLRRVFLAPRRGLDRQSPRRDPFARSSGDRDDSARKPIGKRRVLAQPSIELIRWGPRAAAGAAAAIGAGGVAILFGHVSEPAVRKLTRAPIFSSAELERAARFVREVNGNEFLAARAFVRSALACWFDL